MPGAFIKDIYREIINTKGRFFGIMAIVALGVAFFAGLGATGSDMKLTADKYYSEQQLMDIKVISTFGLNDKDINAIRQATGVDYLFATYSMDAQITHNGLTGNIKVHAYDSDAEINLPRLVSGALPQKSNEAVAEAALMTELGYRIGDKVTLQSGKPGDIRNKLRHNVYVITGIVKTPVYISHERGTSSIGRGEVDFYMMIPQANFFSDVYTEAYVRVDTGDDAFSFSDAYTDRVDEVVKAIEKAGETRVEERIREMTAHAYAGLRDAETALEKNITATQILFDESQAAISTAAEGLPGANAELSGALTEMIAQERVIDENLALVTSSLSAVRDAETELDSQERQLYDSRREVMDYEAYLGAAFSERMRDIDDGLEAVAAGRKTLSEQKQSLYENFNELTEARRILREALTTVYDGSRSLVTGGYALSQQETELAAERVRLTAQLEDARATLIKTREDLDDLDDPKWYVLDRDANPGYAGFSDDSDKIEAIGRVFPLIFFIVAALVCLTSMTRLVEERRTEIGTLKSLGYSNAKIVSKYLFYAVTPTLIGGLAGGYVGMLVFPGIIINAYQMMYSIPAPSTPMQPFFWSMGIGMGLAATGVSTVFACVNELKETPSNLLRPKAPKAGKRTIFERITALWRALNFNQKVTIRNLLRYKKRMLMTVIGIGGCTALMITGFGVKDSIAGIITKQFGEINHYNIVVSFSDSAPEKDGNQANSVLAADGLCRYSLKARQKSMDASAAGSGKTYQAGVVVPETTEGLEHFFTFKNRATREVYTLDNDGVIITEKLSKLLNVKAGDRITLADGDDVRATVRVAAVMEMYFMHYVYMTPDTYLNLFGEKPVNNTLFAVIDDADSERENLLAQALLDEKGVNSVNFIQSTIDSFTNIIGNLNFVVYVLIISAGALALVVLLNLTNININERIRELATIEVLGFYDGEVAMYIYRENAILTVIGAAVGLVMGHFLHLYVILTAETEIMMFGRDIAFISYVYSVALTVFFSLAVNLLTAGKLRKINMVEALKSVE